MVPEAFNHTIELSLYVFVDKALPILRTTKKALGLLQLWDIAEESAGCLLHDAARWEARSLVSQLKAVRETVKGNEQRIEAAKTSYLSYTRHAPCLAPDKKCRLR